MKKIITILCLFAISMTAQNADSTKCKIKPYVSVGVSVGHVDPNDATINTPSKASYPSVEIGGMGKNISLGAVLGYENFLVTSETRPFYELKTSVFKSINSSCSVYGLFGVGAYVEKGFNNFLEYGAGFSYMPNSFGYFVQYSNWARTNYVSFGLTKTF